MPEVVELRVHGVAGTPASELLDRPLVRQVAGDATAGFYRPLLDSELFDEPIPPAAASSRAYLEGYAWGGLTSGAPARALWLLLLPFALLNIAPRLRHDPATSGIRLRILLTLYRWAALGATAALVIAASGVGIDLVGWQCSSSRKCLALPGWFAGFLTNLPPGLRLAVGAVAPVALLVVLWLASRRTAQRYERVPDGKALGATSASIGAGETDPLLSSEWMWRGAYMVDRLRHLHLLGGWTAALVVLDAALGAGALRAVATTVAGLALAAVATGLATGPVVGRAEDPGLRGRIVLFAAWILTLLGTMITTFALGSGSVAPHEVMAHGLGLPGYATIITVGVTVQMLLVVVLAIVSGAPGPWFRRWRGPAFAALGTLLGAVFSAGVYVYAATWLTTGHSVPGLGDVATSLRLTVPSGIQLAAVAFAWTIVGLAAALLIAVLTALGSYLTRRANPAITAALGTDYPGGRNDVRNQQIRSIFWSARLVDRAGTPVTVLIVVVTVAATGVSGIGTLRPGVPASDFWTVSYQCGAYAAAGVLVLLVGLGAAVFRTASTRRSVGILWDLASFWPRSVHPLAPPCYAERTVPDLKERIRWYTAGSGSDYPTGALVLAAHSQGSVIAAAALAQMEESPDDRDLLERVAFLSYGCVLRRLYSTYFPVYFGQSMPAPGRWTNLWRHSDYLGGPVGAPGVDRKLIDPGYARAGGDLGDPRPGRHSMYPRDPEFQDAVSALARLLPQATPGVPGAAPQTTR